jgi:hypothetical protein
MKPLVGDEIQRREIKIGRGGDREGGSVTLADLLNGLTPWCKLPHSNCGFTLQGARVSLTNVYSRDSDNSLRRHLV